MFSWSFWTIIQWFSFRPATNRRINRFGLIQKPVCNFSGEARQSHLLFFWIDNWSTCLRYINQLFTLQISEQCTENFKYQHLAFIGERRHEIRMPTRSTPPIDELYSFTISGQAIWMYFFVFASQRFYSAAEQVVEAILKQVELNSCQTSATAWLQNWHQF